MNEHEAPPADPRESVSTDSPETPTMGTPQAADEPNGESSPTSSSQDPWDFLMNAGSDKGTWMLLGGPFLILVTIICAYGILIAVKRQRENRAFLRHLEEVENPDVLPLPTSQRQSQAESQTEPLTGQPIKPFKVPEDLEPQAPEPKPKEPQEGLPPSKKGIADVRELFPSKTALTPQERTPSPSHPPSGEAYAPREPTPSPEVSLRERLRQGLAKTRDAFHSQIKRIFSGSVTLDDKVLEQLHETLYRADFGVETADQMVTSVKNVLRAETTKNPASPPEDSWQLVEQTLRQKTAALLRDTHGKPLTRPSEDSPWVILIVGVNGVGKTTTIGKLAGHFRAQGLSCLLVAADTFRAAAIEQLTIWGQRIGVDVIRHQSGADPAAVAFDGIKAGIARKADVILIDTAGRLHAKADLMAELGKINRILSRDLPGAPHETWLVIDATTGQNAVQQVKAFKEVVDLSGLVVTKLDGTAKGGVIVGITQQFKIPVRYIGIGEKPDDLKTFSPDEFAESLF